MIWVFSVTPHNQCFLRRVARVDQRDCRMQISTCFRMCFVSVLLLAALARCMASPSGTVIVWGGTVGTNLPPNLTNIVPVSPSLLLVQDGTVVAWGDNYYGETNIPPGITNILAVSTA